jgi:hypothetical protein
MRMMSASEDNYNRWWARQLVAQSERSPQSSLILPMCDENSDN